MSNAKHLMLIRSMHMNLYRHCLHKSSSDRGKKVYEEITLKNKPIRVCENDKISLFM